MVKKLIAELELHVKDESYLGIEPWKTMCLRVLISASCDIHSLWHGFHAVLGTFDPDKFSLSDGLQLYLGTVLDDEGTIHLNDRKRAQRHCEARTHRWNG
jgi:hypothetical protein